jgi:hypothetical protein
VKLALGYQGATYWVCTVEQSRLGVLGRETCNVLRSLDTRSHIHATVRLTNIGPRRAHALISERLAMLYSYEICASFAEEGSCVAGQLPQMRLHHVCATVEALRCKDAVSKLRIELLKCGARHFQIVPNWKGDYHHRARDNAGLV